MNVWGPAPFDNDPAKMFVQEVVEDGQPALREALEVALDPDHDDLPAEEGARAVAAAQIVASAMTAHMGPILDEQLRAWLDAQDTGALADLQELATEALRRVLAPASELPELWADTGEDVAWLAEMNGLLSALGG